MKTLSSPCLSAAIASIVFTIPCHAFSPSKILAKSVIHGTTPMGPLYAIPKRREFLQTASRRRVISNAVNPESGEPPEEEEKIKSVDPAPDGKYDVSKLVGGLDNDGGGFNQFDPVLSATGFLSRRFGIFGGLAVFAALLAVEGGEILKSFDDSVPTAGSGETVTTASGLKITEEIIGKGGLEPAPGYIIGLNTIVSVGDKVIYDTKGAKPIAFKLGQRPFQNVICEGVEEGILGMKAGGKRRLDVPNNLAPPGVDLPQGVPLTYEIELTEVLSGYF